MLQATCQFTGFSVAGENNLEHIFTQLYERLGRF